MASGNPTQLKYLDPEALGRLKNLSLAARLEVEGFFAGMHKSPHRGFSVEFAECLASCGTGPVMMCNDDFYEAVTDKESVEILDKCK